MAVIAFLNDDSLATERRRGYYVGIPGTATNRTGRSSQLVLDLKSFAFPQLANRYVACATPAWVSDTAVFPSVEKMFLAGINLQATSGNVQSGIVSVYSHIGDLIVSGNFGDCDKLISFVSVETTDPDLLLSFLMATINLPRDQIPSRKHFFRQVRDRFAREIGEDETAETVDPLA